MNLDILSENIGGYCKKLDCLYPVYLLYPKIPYYRLIQSEAYFKPLIEKHFNRVHKLQKGDMLVFRFANGFHFGIYAGNEEFFHCCNTFKLRISRLSGYKKFLRGIYRWYHQ